MAHSSEKHYEGEYMLVSFVYLEKSMNMRSNTYRECQQPTHSKYFNNVTTLVQLTTAYEYHTRNLL
jgi:hypothetical protein